MDILENGADRQLVEPWGLRKRVVREVEKMTQGLK